MMRVSLKQGDEQVIYLVKFGYTEEPLRLEQFEGTRFQKRLRNKIKMLEKVFANDNDRIRKELTRKFIWCSILRKIPSMDDRFELLLRMPAVCHQEDEQLGLFDKRIGRKIAFKKAVDKLVGNQLGLNRFFFDTSEVLALGGLKRIRQEFWLEYLRTHLLPSFSNINEQRKYLLRRGNKKNES